MIRAKAIQNSIYSTILWGALAALAIFAVTAFFSVAYAESNSAPSVTGINNVTLTVCDSFDAMDGVSATDPDGDSVQISVDGDNELDSALQNETPGTYTLTYTGDDGRGGFDIVDRTITVEDANCGGGGGTGDNAAPSLTGVGNTTITTCPSTFDPFTGVSATDPDNDPVEITVDGEGALNNALANRQNGTYTLTYTGDDGRGGFDIVDRTVTVNCAAVGGPGGGGGNAAPSITGANNKTIDFCPASFDPFTGVSATDPDNDPVEITVDGEGALNNALANDQTGTFTLTYTGDDGRGGFDIVDRTITVVSADCGVGGPGGGGVRPVARDDAYTTPMNTTLTVNAPGVLGNDTAPPGRFIIARLNLGVQHGTLSLNTNGSFVYTPNTGFTGVDRFTYRIADGTGSEDNATVTITVTPVDGGVTPPTSCTYLLDFLRAGLNNDRTEVLKLQTFLRVYEGYNVAMTGVYDQQTINAVNAFQMRYFSEILAPWGHKAPTGFVYITTRNKINEIVCNRNIPFTTAQLQEMQDFKTLLAQLKADDGAHKPGAGKGQAAAYPKGAGLSPREDNGNGVAVNGNGTTTVGNGTTTNGGVVIPPTDGNGEIAERNFFEGLAAGVYTAVRDVGDFIFSGVFLIILIIAAIAFLLYILSRRSEEDIKDNTNKGHPKGQ